MEPVFRSHVFTDMPEPDYADMSIVVLPSGAPIDPALWARTVFSARSMPLWVLLAFGVRELVAPFIGVPRGSRKVFDVRTVRGEEALLSVDDRHLDFRVAVGVDTHARLVRVITAVRLKGWRGRVYFWPVRRGHPLGGDARVSRARRRRAAA